MNFQNLYARNPDFPNRYILPENLFLYLQRNYSDYITQVGTSYLGKPIYKLSLGTGKTRVLAWTQMHGNESNSTHAITDLLYIFDQNPSLKTDVLSKITLDVILMLNPDGSEKWTRRNAIDIDLNRDYLKESSKEFPILKEIAAHGNYDFALNLHEQRTIFSTDFVHPATLSFLAPAENKDREVTPTRKKSMAIIAKIYAALDQLIPNHIGRYNDEFYPTSTGDNFMKMGLPTILFEGGHFTNDYKRENTRKYFTIALYHGLKAISVADKSDEHWEHYFEIPQNKESHYDLIYRNVKLNMDFPCVLDVAVQFKEIIEEGNDEISFVPMVVEVGDVGIKKGWQEIDCTGKYFKCDSKYPKLDSEVNFEII